MTLINTVFIPTGIVMSGDSRTIGEGYIISDATNKVFMLFNRIGVATAGDAFINLLPIEHYINDFELMNFEEGHNLSVREISMRLYDFIRECNANANVYFIVSGYDANVPFVYGFDTSDEMQIIRVNAYENGQVGYSAAWQGDKEIVTRLLTGEYQPIYEGMNLQDAIDFSRHLIRTTIDQLRFEPRFPSVGGEIDTLIIKPEGCTFVCKKGLTYKI